MDRFPIVRIKRLHIPSLPSLPSAHSRRRVMLSLSFKPTPDRGNIFQPLLPPVSKCISTQSHTLRGTRRSGNPPSHRKPDRLAATWKLRRPRLKSNHQPFPNGASEGTAVSVGPLRVSASCAAVPPATPRTLICFSAFSPGNCRCSRRQLADFPSRECRTLCPPTCGMLRNRAGGWGNQAA